MYDNLMERSYEDFEKLDMAMFGVKYLKKWTSVFCEVWFVFFLISNRLIVN